MKCSPHTACQDVPSLGKQPVKMPHLLAGSSHFFVDDLVCQETPSFGKQPV